MFRQAKAMVVLMARQFMLSRRAANEQRSNSDRRYANRNASRELSLTAGLKAYLRTVFGVGYSRVQKIVDEYGTNLNGKHRELNDDPPHERAPTQKVELDPATVLKARERVRALSKKGRTVTWRELCKWLREHTPDSDTSDSVLRRRLIEEGLGCLRTRSAPAQDMNTPYWDRQRDRFVLQLAEAFEEEAAGRAIVVYCDESFIHRNAKRRITIADTTDPTTTHKERRARPKAVVKTGAGKGQLTILVHAMSSHGLLCEKDKAGQYLRKDMNKNVLTAEVTYASKKSGESDDRDTYHAHWDSHSFLLWFKTALVPVFQKLFGTDKRMYLVLDNSRNHSKRRSDYVPLSGTKAAIAQALVRFGVTRVTVDRGIRHVPAQRAKPARRGKPAVSAPAIPAHDVRDIREFTWSEFCVDHPRGPSAIELRAELRAMYERQPDLQLSELEVLMKTGVSATLRFCSISRFDSLVHSVCSDCSKFGSALPHRF
jgi:hypothetical protein